MSFLFGMYNWTVDSDERGLAALLRRVSGDTHQRRYHHETHLLCALRAGGRRRGNFQPPSTGLVPERSQSPSFLAFHSHA